MTESGVWPEAGLADALVAATGALACIVNGDGRLQMVNPALEQFTGRDAADLVGRRFWDVWVPPEHIHHVREAVAVAMLGGRSFAVEGDWIADGGLRRRVAMHNSVLLDATGRPTALASVGIDVTDIHCRATTDALTGLANRAALFDALAKLLHPVRGTGCGLVFCDLDEFKAVNDAHGHAVGDRLLVEVARRLTQAAQPGDVVARLGGDEFVVLRPHVGLDQAEQLADHVAARLTAPMDTFPGQLALRASIGSAAGQPGEYPDDVLARADRRMYSSKGLRHAARRRQSR